MPAALPNRDIGPIRFIWMNRWSFYVGFGCDAYGRFVAWFGPIYIAVR